MGRLRERLARLEAGVSEQDELETITWADGATLTLPRRRITEILLKASTGRSSLPISPALPDACLDDVILWSS